MSGVRRSAARQGGVDPIHDRGHVQIEAVPLGGQDLHLDVYHYR